MHRSTVRHLVPLLATLALVLAGCRGDTTPSIDTEDIPDQAVGEGEGSSPAAVEDEGESSQDEDGDAGIEADPEDEEDGDDDVPTFEEVCEGRDDEAFIEILTPVQDAEVGRTFTVTGCGNTFEATVEYRVELDGGGIGAEGFWTMTCGSGCVGTFEEEVTVDGTGAATLVLFETSAEDGSETNVVERDILVQ